MRITQTPQQNGTLITIDNNQFIVPNHWFWPEFASHWEPQTSNFFERYIDSEREYLDIGGWVGPTAMLATACGAKHCTVVEPNPANFYNLLLTQFNNNLLDRWTLVNACVSSEIGRAIIGPVEGISRKSSATNIMNPDKGGAEIISFKLLDLLDRDYSLIKIDIEGAESYIIKDMLTLTERDTVVWFSVHPPFVADKLEFVKDIVNICSEYWIVDDEHQIMDPSTLISRIESDEEKPSWGTKYGNFFEVGLLPKKFFDQNGERIE